ncbi:MAG: sulfite exporter TauE/SafE family protein [Acidimicrobiia bacterium]
MANDVVLVAVGCLTGVLAGMLGAGGGFATVVLLLAAGEDTHVAVGTSLVYLLVMGAWGTFVHLRSRSVDFRLALRIGVAAALAAVLGAQLAEALSEPDLTLALGLFTAAVTGASLAWPLNRRPAVEGETVEAIVAGKGTKSAPAGGAGPPPEPTPREVGAAVVGGGVIGVLKGMFSVGAGFLVVPLMVLAGRVRREVAVGSSIFAVLFASVAATLSHANAGAVDWGGLAWMIPGGLFGSFVGTRTGSTMSSAAIRRVYVAMMVIATVYLAVLASSF